jgi:hypothetical protein
MFVAVVIMDGYQDKYRPLTHHPLPRLALLHLVELGNLIQELTRFQWICDPCRRTCQPGLEVVGPSTQELVANVQRLPALNTSEDTLTG